MMSPRYHEHPNNPAAVLYGARLDPDDHTAADDMAPCGFRPYSWTLVYGTSRAAFLTGMDLVIRPVPIQVQDHDHPLNKSVTVRGVELRIGDRLRASDLRPLSDGSWGSCPSKLAGKLVGWFDNTWIRPVPSLVADSAAAIEGAL
jgi:hypothetical protein